MKSCFLVVWFALLSSFVSPQLSLCQSPKTKNKVLLQRGVALKFSLMRPLSSSSAKVGDDVPLRLERPLVIDGVHLLEPGIIAHGKVTRVKAAGPKCRRGEVQWKLDSVAFGDSSTAKTEVIMAIARVNAAVPESYPSNAIQRGRHDAWKWIVFSPLLVIEFPILLIGMSGEGGGPCTTPGEDYVLPANSTIAVAIAKNHHVHY